MKHGRPQWGEGAKVGALPRKIMKIENKRKLCDLLTLMGAIVAMMGPFYYYFSLCRPFFAM